MSAAVYSEPYKAPAGALALAVHGAFFALLYFGFSWQTQPAATMSVDLWRSLPEEAKVAPPTPPEKKVEPEAARPPQPEKKAAPEIALPEKKKPAPAPEKKAETRSAKQEAEARIAERVAREQAERDARAHAEQVARERAKQAAATGRAVDEFTGKIVGKIRRNIVMPPNVADDARAEFSVTLLPGGTVLSAKLTRSSGNAVYDGAVERAILKSQPLPLPADVALFVRFRELKLVFRPVE